jgi:hypothetical protein
LLAVGLSCGLRRNEIAKLTVETIQQRSGRWVLVDIIGKQGRIRSVPIAPWAKDSINDWLSAAGIDIGFVFRAINKTGCVRAGKISAQAVYEIIKGYGVDIAVTVAPHDLRRSFARLAHSGNSPIEQIQLSLGHASIATTERYIGVRQNLSDAPCDRLGIMLPGNPCPVFEDEEWTTRDVEPDGWERFLPAAPIVTTLYASGWAVAGAAYTMFADFSGEDFGRRSTVGA